MSSLSMKTLQNSNNRRRHSVNNSGQSSQETVSGQQPVRTLPPNSPFLHGNKRIPVALREPINVLLEDAIEQLKMMGIIGGHKKKSMIKSSVAEEMSRFFDMNQEALEMQFQQLTQDPDAFTNQLKNPQTDAKDIKQSHNTAKNLQKIESERHKLTELLGKIAREIMVDGHFQSALDVITEENSKKDVLQQTVKREQEAVQTLKHLQQSVSTEQKSFEDELAKREQTIQQLRDTIQELRQLSNTKQKYIKKEARTQETSVKQQCQHKETQKTNEKKSLQHLLDMETEAHNTVVDFLNWQREQLEIQIQEWMEKYERDTEQKTQDIELLKQKRASDSEHFEQLTKELEKLTKLVEEENEKRRIFVEASKQVLLQKQMVRRIQRWWRRTHPKGKGKGGKKSAKGKKK